MDIPEGVERILAQLRIPNSKLDEIRDAMAREFMLGLNVGGPDATVPMITSFVPALPDGSERGKYLSLDLSGKNLRVMLLSLAGRNEDPQVISQNFVVHQDVMVGTGEQLFNFIVNKLASFLEEQDLLTAGLPLGFVFSYPVEMKGIRNAKLRNWTKGFNVPDCLNQDVGLMLEEGLKRHGTIQVKVKAIMNDTVGQLAAAAYRYGPDCQMGVVVGYGCNAAYLEDVANIKKFNAENFGYKFPKMVIDTEWEEFGAHGELDSIMTQFDKEIDDNSVHKGKQIIDKLTGAYFLGGLVRRILGYLATEGVLFGGIKPEFLATPDAFPSKFISEILSDDETATIPFKNIRRIMDELHVPVHGTMEYIATKEICRAVSLRSACIAAAAISALMKVINRPKIIVGVGGALIQYHPTYHAMLRDKLNELVPPAVVEWDIVPAEDGSGKGAALVAATAENLKL